MDILSVIKSRRSIRKFKDKRISKERVHLMLEAARWAPSGLNNQPWRFKIVYDKEKIEKIASFSKFGTTIKKAPVLIIVFLDKDASYDRIKDIQAIGACIQNMLLVAQSKGLGTCWMGEILNQREEVEEYLEVDESLELMAVICVGEKAGQGSSDRKDLRELKI